MKASMEGVRSIGMTARSRGESKDQSLRESRHPLLDDSAEAPHGPSRRTHDQGEQPLIRRKTVVLKNDYIHHVVDVYHF